jgi:hypothetical protein
MAALGWKIDHSHFDMPAIKAVEGKAFEASEEWRREIERLLSEIPAGWKLAVSPMQWEVGTMTVKYVHVAPNLAPPIEDHGWTLYGPVP